MTWIGRYVGAVAHQWISVVGGSVLSAAALVWSVFGPETAPIPWRVSVWGFPITGLVAGALAWKAMEGRVFASEAQLQEHLRARPDPIVQFRAEGSAVVMSVRNRGAQAAFWITVQSASFSGRPLDTRPVWSSGTDERRVLGTGQEAESRFLTLTRPSNTNINGVPQRRQTWRVWTTEVVATLSHVIDPPTPRVEATLVVDIVAEPPIGRLIRSVLKIDGPRVQLKESGEWLSPLHADEFQ